MKSLPTSKRPCSLKLLLPLALFITCLVAAADDASPAQAEFLSLDGKSIPAGNPIEPNSNVRLILHVKDAALWIHRTKAPTPLGTVLLCPGGAYVALEMRNEGENTARALNELGYDAAILEYHIADGANERDIARDDALKAYRLIRSKGASLGLHSARVDLMGYSAGGHLAARATEKLGRDEQPKGLILVYAAYLNENSGSGSNPAVVPPSHPGRLLALIAANDNPQWVQGLQAYAKAWSAAGGDATFHLLPDGGHGFGMTAKSADSTQHWFDLLRTFLKP